MMLVGYDNGYFKVLEKTSRKNKNREYFWKCECRCGKIHFLRTGDIKSCLTHSCGCKRKGINKNITHTKKHGLSKHPIYHKWYSIKYRCKNVKDAKFYKEKGIIICEEWDKDFLKFYQWCISNGWKKGLTIDRIDNKKNYSPENCQFLTQSENSKKTPLENRRGEKNHFSKLKVEDIIKIRKMIDKGMKGFEIAKIFSTTKQNIYMIKNGKTWKHV